MDDIAFIIKPPSIFPVVFLFCHSIIHFCTWIFMLPLLLLLISTTSHYAATMLLSSALRVFSLQHVDNIVTKPP